MSFSGGEITRKSGQSTDFSKLVDALDKRASERHGSVSRYSKAEVATGSRNQELLKLAKELDDAANHPGASAGVQVDSGEFLKVASDLETIVDDMDRAMTAIEKVAMAMVCAEAEDRVRAVIESRHESE